MADDTAPTGTTVTAITNANGVSTLVGAGGVDIQGNTARCTLIRMAVTPTL
ncbi:Bacillopeptidase F Esterase; RP-I protease; 90 kDa serine proteinase; Flags: Precursor [Salmonella enterica subsp. diarizonae]|uniref:AmyH3 protein n=1 Tax=Salmonella diarizonae TaxID=59204 RepID=A0A379TVH4_SALDZ|nr:Bacillopeptidase F Esterase; RP-I protease; 90 kDa serine proteinase; Flags: Precursor [Salmonella enterica subsp. diarizonae]